MAASTSCNVKVWQDEGAGQVHVRPLGHKGHGFQLEVPNARTYVLNELFLAASGVADELVHSSVVVL
jgi:hypothetical protein